MSHQTKVGRTAAIAAVLFLAGCSGGPASTDAPNAAASASVAAASASATPEPTRSALPHVADTYDIGGGRKLFMECTGEGSPTVIR